MAKVLSYPSMILSRKHVLDQLISDELRYLNAASDLRGRMSYLFPRI